ncbi:MAG TPA: hypothetical protein VF181_00840 [Balneolaceae bacterium]
MAHQQESLSEKESLNIIQEMIGKAKGDLRGSSFYILLWGWVVFAGSIIHYLLLTFSTIRHPEWAWLIIVIGIAGSIIKGIIDRKNEGASTYSGHLHTVVWVTFMVNYFIILFFIAKVNFYIMPLVLIMAASSTYLSGSIIKFTPLKLGAVFIWLMAIAGFLLSLPYQLLAGAAALLFGYLVPGYMLKYSGE